MPRVKVVTKERTKQPITHLAVGGFKSIRDRCELELRPLTLLCGRNSSGKSSFMQPFLLMKQTLEAPIDPGPLLLHGPNVKFTELEQLYWSGPRSKKTAPNFQAGFRNDTQSFSVFYRTDETSRGAAIDRQEFVQKSGLVETLHERMTKRTLDALATAVYHYDAYGTVERERCILLLHVENVHSPDTRRVFLPEPLAEEVLSQLQSLIHLPGLRGNPERAYLSMPIGDRFVGPFHPYTASVIAHWQDKSDLRIRRLGEWLARLELSSAAVAQRLDATRVELRVSRLPGLAKTTAKDLVNIADVGIGVSQVLPLLVALLVAEPGQIVYVEQPEIHLHPSAEVALSEIVLEAARRGVIVVAETHSQRLLRGIQTAVAADSSLAPLVKLHWFSRGKDGATHVESADLDEHGAFGDWPEDLADVELAIEERYLRAALAQCAE